MSLTKYGHTLAAYVFFVMALSHWLTARRLVDEEHATKTAPAAAPAEE